MERHLPFRDGGGRDDFVASLPALTVCAWTLLPNRVHLFVRTGTRPPPCGMRSLLTGCPDAFTGSQRVRLHDHRNLCLGLRGRVGVQRQEQGRGVRTVPRPRGLALRRAHPRGVGFGTAMLEALASKQPEILPRPGTVIWIQEQFRLAGKKEARGAAQRRAKGNA